MIAVNVVVAPLCVRRIYPLHRESSWASEWPGRRRGSHGRERFATYRTCSTDSSSRFYRSNYVGGGSEPGARGRLGSVCVRGPGNSCFGGFNNIVNGG